MIATINIALIGIIFLFVLGGGGVFAWQMLRRKGVVNAGFTVDPWSHGVKLEDVTPHSLSFEFPVGDGVHLIDKRGEPKGLPEMSMTFEIRGANPEFVSMEGDKAQVRLHMAGARLWSHQGADLKVGRQTFTVPLKPEYWQTVDGYPCSYDQAHRNQFADAVAKEKSVGFTFGGENHGYAHGAGLSKSSTPATFRLIDFKP